MRLQGHLFVVQADLSRIAADAFLIPCDSDVNMSGGWRPFVERAANLARPGTGSGQQA